MTVFRLAAPLLLILLCSCAEAPNPQPLSRDQRVAAADGGVADGARSDTASQADAGGGADRGALSDAMSSQDDSISPDSAIAADASVVWRQANLTWYTSYPDPGSEECIDYNGCEWAGYFAALDEQQPESWVAVHNIAAVHSKDFSQYKLKTLRLRSGGQQIDVTVYDMCADSDCDGCCTANSQQTGFLIDIESYTADRFGVRDGVVEWRCLDC